MRNRLLLKRIIGRGKFGYGSAAGLCCLIVSLLGCGQETLILPPGSSEGACGEWYPGGDADGADVYGFEEGKILPCAVFESARLAGEDTYISLGSLYLDATHGHSDAVSAVIVIGADNCPSCGVFIRDLVAEIDRIEAAHAALFNVTFCDNMDRTDCDFDLDRAVSTAEGEGWPVDRYPVTNDAEGHLKSMFRDSFPTVIVARVSDMEVAAVDRVPDAERLVALLETM